jgi:hypothetical protein
MTSRAMRDVAMKEMRKPIRDQKAGSMRKAPNMLVGFGGRSWREEVYSEYSRIWCDREGSRRKYTLAQDQQSKARSKIPSTNNISSSYRLSAVQERKRSVTISPLKLRDDEGGHQLSKYLYAAPLEPTPFPVRAASQHPMLECLISPALRREPPNHAIDRS